MKTQDDDALECPRCGSAYLHAAAVIFYQRDEDADTVLRTHVQGRHASVSLLPNAGSGNPSFRRDGVVLGFWCEICGTDDDRPDLFLTFAQHKGATVVQWTFEPET